MARALGHPDENSSAKNDAENSLESLRHLLGDSDPALPYNEASKARIGRVIGDAVLPSRLRAAVRSLGPKG